MTAHGLAEPGTSVALPLGQCPLVYVDEFTQGLITNGLFKLEGVQQGATDGARLPVVILAMSPWTLTRLQELCRRLVGPQPPAAPAEAGGASAAGAAPLPVSLDLRACPPILVDDFAQGIGADGILKLAGYQRGSPDAPPLPVLILAITPGTAARLADLCQRLLLGERQARDALRRAPAATQAARGPA